MMYVGSKARLAKDLAPNDFDCVYEKQIETNIRGRKSIAENVERLFIWKN